MPNLAPFIEKIKEKNTLSSIISEDVKLLEKGQSMVGTCPFHNEKTPSFTVNDHKGFYHCFGCGAHGDLISYIMNTKKYSFFETIEYLAHKSGIVLPRNSTKENLKYNQDNELKKLLEETNIFFEETLKTSLGEKARDYLKERGLTEHTIREFQIGFSSKTRSLYPYLKEKKFSEELISSSGLVLFKDVHSIKNRFNERVMFPISNDKGKIIAFGARTLTKDVLPKYINSSDSNMFHKNQTLYNFHRAKNFININNSLIITEGYLDVILMHQIGIKTSVATLGTALSEYHVMLLWKYCSSPIFCFDGDKAGYNAAIRSIQLILSVISPEKSASFVFLPDQEDPASMIQNKNQSDLLSLIKNPIPLHEVIKKDIQRKIRESQTPEQKASVRQYIKDTILLIKHADLRKLYTYDLNKVFDEEVNFLYKTNISHKKTSSPFPILNKKPSFSKKNTLSQKILLATLINHPKLIIELHDFFIQVVFSKTSWDRMRGIMLSYNEESDGVFYPFLVSNKLEGDIEEICEQEIFTHAPFARKEESIEVAKKGWMDVWNNTVWKNAKNNDFNKIKDHVKKNMNSQNWEKLKTIKLKSKQNY